MARLTIKEAVEISPVSESTLRRDIKSGKVSSEKDERGRRRIDTAELARVYGQLRQSTHSNDTEMNAVDTPNNGTVNTNDSPDTSDTPTDNPKIIALMDNQIADLKSQLEHANAEKKELLELANRLQKQNEVLMLPNSEQAERKDKGWLLRFVGAR